MTSIQERFRVSRKPPDAARGRRPSPRSAMRRLLLVCLLAASACSKLPDPKDHPGFAIKEVRQGEGPAVGASDTVRVHYVGRFPGGDVFERSEKGKPKEYSLYARTLIPGFKLGLLGMKKGGKRVVTIPPSLAFGEKGKMGRIPPHATLVFELELVEIR